MATAGRTVVYSALTVAVALITLTVFPLGFLKSMGIAGAVVAWSRPPRRWSSAPACSRSGAASSPAGPSQRPEDRGRWYRLSLAVMRRPGAIAAATAVVMIVLAAPALRANWTPVDSSVIPLDQSSRTVADTWPTTSPDPARRR